MNGQTQRRTKGRREARIHQCKPGVLIWHQPTDKLEKSKNESNTAIQKLSDAGLRAREIMAVSGHRWDAFDSKILCRSPNIKYVSKQKFVSQVWKLTKIYWRPSMESRKRWSDVLSDWAVNSSETHIMPPKRLSMDSYFSGCTINVNIQINVNDTSSSNIQTQLRSLGNVYVLPGNSLVSLPATELFVLAEPNKWLIK